MQHDYLYLKNKNMVRRMPNGHYGPWAIVSKVSSMKSVKVINTKGQADIVPVSCLKKIRAPDGTHQTTLFSIKKG